MLNSQMSNKPEVAMNLLTLSMRTGNWSINQLVLINYSHYI